MVTRASNQRHVACACESVEWGGPSCEQRSLALQRCPRPRCGASQQHVELSFLAERGVPVRLRAATRPSHLGLTLAVLVLAVREGPSGRQLAVWTSSRQSHMGPTRQDPDGQDPDWQHPDNQTWMEPTVFVCLAAARALRLTRSRPPSPPRRGNVAGAVEGAAEGAAEGAVGLLPPPKRLKRRGGLVVVAFALAGGSAGSDRVEGALGGGGASCGDLAGGGCCSPWLSPACWLPFSPPDRVGLAWPSTPAPADPTLLDASADAQETLGWGEEGLYA
eukprot:CAMPEP_0181206144 /NCGR_PEP_ID=MMETSP1096-20121128/20874_1 /TAXON_ID=156174 ORGANISM="Chrysochromulina ericina, Strain CCMP281" /NCGR_SAMPLE_ID=MMETSP1096 /ASSEMBLY_ACC=CAM_ASM_000453 /LENGTH=275 /DNA_ID=CAMNT_0023297015 /DNA_START=363 /DNA_END=1188 /DNA_ORIENTATION=+